MTPSQLFGSLATVMLLGLFSSPAIAQIHSYPLSTRAFFLTGCLSEDPPDFTQGEQAYLQMRACLCLLDKFQQAYTHEQFQKLFAEAEAQRSPQARELEQFAEQQLPYCL